MKIYTGLITLVLILISMITNRACADLQAEFPLSVRYWSDDPYVHPEGDGLMHHDSQPTGAKNLAVWGRGSIVIDAAP